MSLYLSKSSALVFLVIILLLTGCSTKNSPFKPQDTTQLDQALENNARAGNYQSAADIYRNMAQSNPEAAYHLAKLYSSGEIDQDDRNKNFYNYVKWMLVSRGQGYGPALLEWHNFVEFSGQWLAFDENGLDEYGRLNNLGVEYAYGQNGKVQDFDKAYELIVQAYKGGNLIAAFNLGGIHYYEGPIKYRDYQKALEYYRLAADRGLAEPKYFLGEAYETGRGVRRNYEVAASWYSRAVDQGSQISAYRLGLLLYEGKIRAVGKFGKKQSAKAAHMAEVRDMFRMAGEGVSGHPMGAYMAGVMAEKGQGGPKNLTEARKWYETAVRLGFEKAKIDLNRLKNY